MKSKSDAPRDIGGDWVKLEDVIGALRSIYAQPKLLGVSAFLEGLQRERMGKRMGKMTHEGSPLNILRFKDLQKLLKFSRTTVVAKIKDEGFPQPIILGRRMVAWKESEVQAWIDSRPRGKCDKPVKSPSEASLADSLQLVLTRKTRHSSSPPLPEEGVELKDKDKGETRREAEGSTTDLPFSLEENKELQERRLAAWNELGHSFETLSQSISPGVWLAERPEVD